MKCTNCGAEVSGKFCTNCGTPASETPVSNVPNVEPVPMATPNTDFPTFDNMPLQNDVTPQSTSFSQEQPYSPYQSEPVNQQNNPYSAQPNNFGSYQNVQPNQNYGSNPYGQPVQPDYSANNNYAGQPFTPSDIPNAVTSVQGGKKKSGGKVAAIVISIVLVVFILFAVVIGVIIWNFTNKAKETFSNFSSGLSSSLDENSDDFNFEFNYNYDSDESSDDENDYVYNNDLTDYIINTNDECDEFGWYYVPDPEDNSKVIITGLNLYIAKEYIDTSSYTITIPESIEGKKIEQVYDLYVYNPDIDNFNVKLVVPGTVKIVHDNAFDYSEDCLTEVVFEEGVESIGYQAIFRCDKIKKITVPDSVKSIGEQSLGFTYNEEFDVVLVDGVTIVTKKGSAADEFAKQNNIKVEYN